MLQGVRVPEAYFRFKSFLKSLNARKLSPDHHGVQEARNFHPISLLSQLRGCVLQGVYVPEMHERLTRRRVLVMEWVDGVRLKSAGEAPGARPALSKEDLRLVEVFSLY